jgi:dTMP kinase
VTRGRARRRGRGRFLVLEGLDGAGTTTQAQRLAAWLREQGRKVHVTAEPSGGPVGALVRQILARRIVGGATAEGATAPFDPGALALLFAADRLDHVAAEVAPRLAEGYDVVSDRYTLSSLAYQSLTCGDEAWVEAVNGRAPAPDVTLFLEVSAATAVRRRFAASSHRELYEVPAFQRRVASSYRRALARLQELGQRVLVVDGERPVAEVTAALAERLRPLL